MIEVVVFSTPSTAQMSSSSWSSRSGVSARSQATKSNSPLTVHSCCTSGMLLRRRSTSLPERGCRVMPT
ncbi:hypothetical protein D3C75_962050 [compost metagenome]